MSLEGDGIEEWKVARGPRSLPHKISGCAHGVRCCKAKTRSSHSRRCPPLNSRALSAVYLQLFCSVSSLDSFSFYDSRGRSNFNKLAETSCRQEHGKRSPCWQLRSPSCRPLMPPRYASISMHAAGYGLTFFYFLTS